MVEVVTITNGSIVIQETPPPIPFAIKMLKLDPSKVLKAKIKFVGSVGQILAIANAIWAGFMLFLSALNYFLLTPINFGLIPGVTTIYAIVQVQNGDAGTAQLGAPFFIYQSVQIAITDFFLEGISNNCETKLDWYLMTFGLGFCVELVATCYVAMAINCEFLFIVGSMVYIIFRFYSLKTARKLQNLVHEKYLMDKAAAKEREPQPELGCHSNPVDIADELP